MDSAWIDILATDEGRTAMSLADAHKKDSAPNKPAPPGHLVIQVYNEDAGGPPVSIDGGPGEKLSKLIVAVYDGLGLEPKPGDRLTCLATGEDVRQYGDMHLQDYASGECRDLVWTFARDTGGADA